LVFVMILANLLAGAGAGIFEAAMTILGCMLLRGGLAAISGGFRGTGRAAAALNGWGAAIC
jgi:hypothetical protein